MRQGNKAGVMRFMKSVTETTERPDAKIEWVRAELNQARPVNMMRSKRRNAVSRESILRQIQGVKLAIRRRDNALRLKLTQK